MPPFDLIKINSLVPLIPEYINTFFGEYSIKSVVRGLNIMSFSDIPTSCG